MKIFISVLILVLFGGIINGQQRRESMLSSNSFIIRPNVVHDKIEVMICDSSGNQQFLNGNYQFSLNGFSQELQIKNGVGVFPQRISQSTFIYARNENSNQSKLYYLFKMADSIKLVKVNSWVLIAIPVILIALASLFRGFIMFSAVFIVCWLLFNTTNGLSLSTLLSTCLDGLRNFF